MGTRLRRDLYEGRDWTKSTTESQKSWGRPLSRLWLWCDLDARRPRRRLGLHRPSDDRKRHCPNGYHRNTRRREHEWPGPPLGLAGIADRLREVREDLLRCRDFVRDGLLRVLEFLC